MPAKWIDRYVTLIIRGMVGQKSTARSGGHAMGHLGADALLRRARLRVGVQLIEREEQLRERLPQGLQQIDFCLDGYKRLRLPGIRDVLAKLARRVNWTG